MSGCGENNFSEKRPNPTRSGSASTVFTQNLPLLERGHDICSALLSFFLSSSAHPRDVPSLPAATVSISVSLLFLSSDTIPNPSALISAHLVTLISFLSHLSSFLLSLKWFYLQGLSIFRSRFWEESKNLRSEFGRWSQEALRGVSKRHREGKEASEESKAEQVTTVGLNPTGTDCIEQVSELCPESWGSRYFHTNSCLPLLGGLPQGSPASKIYVCRV